MSVELAGKFKAVCVFCGSSSGNHLEYVQAAEQVGKYLAEQSMTLIYGGGQLGLMGVVANAALAAGGQVVGIIPDALAVAEVAHAGLSELIVVRTMHERKAKMAELCDAFLALPGGFGTFEEFCEALTWSQLDIHRKPCGLLNVRGYYDPLIRLFDHAVSEGFLKERYHKMAIVGTELEELMYRMQISTVDIGEPVFKWLD